MNTKETPKNIYIINKNQSPSQNYKQITDEFGIWEKIRYQYIKIFDSAKLQQFYFDSGIKKYSKEVKQTHPKWYHEDSKKLAAGFAIDLHILLKNIFLIQPILEATFASIDNKEGSQKIPWPIEFVFHTLLTRSTIESYPFTIQNLSKGIDVSQNVNISRRNMEKIQTYLNDISIINAINVDEEYAEWVSLYKVYDSCILEFLRRFYAYVSLAYDATDELPWNAVSIGAVGHYLAELYDALNGVTMTDDGLTILLLLHESLAIYDSKKFNLSNNEIMTAWQNISATIKKFQEDDVIFKLTIIAHNDPMVGRELDHKTYDLFEQFQQDLPERVGGLTPIINNQAVNNHIKGLIEKTNKYFISKITEIGTYTSENADKVETLGLNRFRYVVLFATLKLWLLQFVNPWLLPFLNFLLIENVLTLVHKDKVDKIYRRLFALSKDFDKFCEQVEPQLIANKKMMLFLQGAKISEGEKHLVKILVNDFNDRAEQIVKELRPTLLDLKILIDLILADFQNNTNILFKKIEVVKQSNIDIEKKLTVFIEVCGQLDEMLELTDKTKQK